MGKIDQKTENKVLDDLKKNIPYSEIAAKYNIGKATVYRIKNRADKNLEVKKPSKKTISHRRKIQEKAIQRNIINKSELIVNGVINVMDGINYSITNLVEINEESKEKTEKIIEELEKLNKTVDEKLKANSTDDVKEKNDLIKDIYKVIGAAGNFYARETVRIKAITELRGQMDTFLKYEVLIKAIHGLREKITAIFNGMHILSNEDYKRYRNRVIELDPTTRDLFEEFEKEV